MSYDIGLYDKTFLKKANDEDLGLTDQQDGETIY